MNNFESDTRPQTNTSQLETQRDVEIVVIVTKYIPKLYFEE